MKKVAYFGTDGDGRCGHYFRPIMGEFTKEDKESIESIDGMDAFYRLFDTKKGINKIFFLFKNYICLGVPYSPDDSRGGSKTVVFMELPAKEEDVEAVIRNSSFLRNIFKKLHDIYNINISFLEDEENTDR